MNAALELKGKSRYHLMNRGYIYYLMGDYEQAKEQLLLAVEIEQKEGEDDKAELYLAQTAEKLSRTLEERCLSEAGVSLRLNIILSQTAEGVEAAEVQIVPRDAVTASQKRAIEALLEGQLQPGPECIKWNSPSGEDVP